MIKICGVVLMLVGSMAYLQTSDLWFAQAGVIGILCFFSEALFDYAINLHSEGLIDIAEVQNAQA